MGAEITEMRKKIKNQAYEIALKEASSLEEKEQIVIKHAKKLKNRGTQRDSRILKLNHEDYQEQTPVGLRKRTGKKRGLDVASKIDICHKVLCLMYT